MPFGPFLLFTFLGALVWNSILAVIGYIAAGQMDTIKKYSHELSVAILALFGAVLLFFIVKKIISALSKRK